MMLDIALLFAALIVPPDITGVWHYGDRTGGSAWVIYVQPGHRCDVASWHLGNDAVTYTGIIRRHGLTMVEHRRMHSFGNSADVLWEWAWRDQAWFVTATGEHLRR